MKSIKEMTLKEKIGQLILPGFHGFEYDEHLRTLIEDYHVGNVILFTRNFENAEQMKKLTTKIHEEIIKNTGVIPFIAIDQEGGLVTRMMKDVTFAAGPMTSSSVSEQAVYDTGKMLAYDMIQLGMNLNLAPSLDVNNNPNNPVINVRSYSDNPEIVSKMGKNFIKGSLEYGVLPCAKHFPGHGDAAVDSHLGLPIINHDTKRIHEVEMKPFIDNINIPSIMSAHILFPAYDTVPATLSKNVITGVLREELGYDGIVITDCLEMKAIADQYGTEKGALLAVLAGIDLLCICHTLEKQIGALKLIEEAVLNGTLKEEELDKHVERILKGKEKTIPYLNEYFYNKELHFSSEYKKRASEIVDASLTHILGDKPVLTDKTLIIAPVAQARTIIEDEFDERNLAKVLAHSFDNINVYEMVNEEGFKKQIIEEAKKYDQVIVFSYNANVTPWQVEFINEIIKVNKTFVISLKGPFDYHKYNNLQNYMCLYEYTPNSIKTVVKYLKGELEPKGVLPIKL